MTQAPSDSTHDLLAEIARTDADLGRLLPERDSLFRALNHLDGYAVIRPVDGDALKLHTALHAH